MIRRSISTGLAYEDIVGYSRALVVGDWVFVSGTTGRDRVTNAIPEGIVEQTHNTFATIIWALEEAGSSMAEVVRGRIAVSDRKYEAGAHPGDRPLPPAGEAGADDLCCRTPRSAAKDRDRRDGVAGVFRRLNRARIGRLPAD